MKEIHENSTLSFLEERAAGRTASFRRAVFELIRRSARPVTDREIMDALSEPDPNNVRPEITRLKQDGLIAEAGKVRCARTGKTVRTSRATGRAYFNRGEAPEPPVPELVQACLGV